MSNQITNLCKWLHLPPAQKAVLMSLADIADDNGHAWPSQAWIAVWTGFKRTAIITAVKGLEAANLIHVERTVGKANRTEINAVLIAGQIQTVWRTGTNARLVLNAVNKWAAAQTGPVHPANLTRPRDEPDTSEQPNIKKQKENAPTAVIKKGLPADWVVSRELESWATAERPDINVDQCAKAFRSHYLSTGDTRANWNEAFKLWAMREKQSLPAATATAPAPAQGDRDPALIRIEADRKRAVPPTADQRATLEALKKTLGGGIRVSGRRPIGG